MKTKTWNELNTEERQAAFKKLSTICGKAGAPIRKRKNREAGTIGAFNSKAPSVDPKPLSPRTRCIDTAQAKTVA